MRTPLPQVGGFFFGRSISILVSRHFPIGQWWLPTSSRERDRRVWVVLAITKVILEGPLH